MLFLDEIGEVSPALQVRQLRTLQNGEIRAADPISGAAWVRGETPLAVLERKAILHALKQTCGNRAAAVRFLRVSERSLDRKLDRNRHKPRDLRSV